MKNEWKQSGKVKYERMYLPRCLLWWHISVIISENEEKLIFHITLMTNYWSEQEMEKNGKQRSERFSSIPKFIEKKFAKDQRKQVARRLKRQSCNVNLQQ